MALGLPNSSPLHWQAYKANLKDGKNRRLKWEPILRFPNAIRYTYLGQRLLFADLERRRVGYLVTVQGTFKFVQNLRAFPFDKQGLRLVVQLGVELNAKEQLYAEDYLLVQNPEQPNLIFGQQDPEFLFRPPRFKMTTTGVLEAAAPISK